MSPWLLVQGWLFPISLPLQVPGVEGEAGIFGRKPSRHIYIYVRSLERWKIPLKWMEAGGYGDGSAVKNTGYFCRKIRVWFPPPTWLLPYVCNSTPGIPHPLVASTKPGMHMVHMWASHTHTHKIKLHGVIAVGQIYIYVVPFFYMRLLVSPASFVKEVALNFPLVYFFGGIFVQNNKNRKLACCLF